MFKNMEKNISILDQIINNQQAEEVANLDAVEIINNLFGELSDRERDVIIRRHGLHGEGKETLESIGAIHNLTRERIRQIESSSIKKLQQLNNLENYISTLKKIIYQLLEEHGGLMEKEYLLNILVGFSLGDYRAEDVDEAIHKNYLNFMITKLLHTEFEETSSRHFKDAYKLKYQTLEHFESILENLLETIREQKKIRKTDDLINLIRGLEAYSKHEEKIKEGGDGNLDISRALKSELYEENADLINRHKALYSLLKVARKIEQNKFGYWGIHNWPEIKPKTINDKIYLVMKNEGKPMHFAEIARCINEIGFDNKLANAATVHNELILDDKYILVGRGIYSLKEWGYTDGTVTDVIEGILSEIEGGAAARDEIIDKVLEKRVVKKATIILALMNKNKFERAEGKYKVRQSL